MRVGVLGAGFGLYGYLPALVSLGHIVILPHRYRETVEKRRELAGFLDQIEWQADDDAVLDGAAALILARRPEDQLEFVPRILARSRLARVILEKPLARDPDEAARLHRQLAESGNVFRVGYTFVLTEWARRLPSCTDIDISWRFRAHHYATNSTNWKRRHSSGGGALRFYGTQVIGLLAWLGYDTVESSLAISAAADEVETWQAVFSKADRGQCHVTVESNADQPGFRVATGSFETSADLRDPFGEQGGPQDRRVPLLAALCADALNSDRPFYDWYEAAIALWRQVEGVTARRNG